MSEPLRHTSADGPLEPMQGAPPHVAVFIESMNEEQVALLTEDLVDVLTRRAQRQQREVASEPP
jgi:hypothetical protein